MKTKSPIRIDKGKIFKIAKGRVFGLPSILLRKRKKTALSLYWMRMMIARSIKRIFFCKPFPENPESIRDAKGWLKDRMPRGLSYKETINQKEFTRIFDMEAARKRSPSFDKLWRDIRCLIDPSASR